VSVEFEVEIDLKVHDIDDGEVVALVLLAKYKES
jgi:hypothetical protein